MPTGRVDQTVHLGTRSTIDLMNETSLQRPGELGKRTEIAGKAYQVVQLDSGATAASGAGVVASGQIAFWKNKATYTVTNDKVQAIGGPGLTSSANSLAGILVTAVTAGNYCAIQQRGRCNVATDGGGDFVAGGWVVAKQSVATAIGDFAAGTSTAPVDPVGKIFSAEASSLTATDLYFQVEVP